MDDVLERARRARYDARVIRASSLLRAAGAHDRSAAIARNIAHHMTHAGAGSAEALHSARDHELTAQLLRRRARWLRNLRMNDIEVNVHLAFPDVSRRDDVMALLHELGPWEGGELVDRPDRGVFFRIASDDLILCELAVRERLRFALAPLLDWEQLVTLHTVWPRRL